MVTAKMMIVQMMFSGLRTCQISNAKKTNTKALRWEDVLNWWCHTRIEDFIVAAFKPGTGKVPKADRMIMGWRAGEGDEDIDLVMALLWLVQNVLGFWDIQKPEDLNDARLLKYPLCPSLRNPKIPVSDDKYRKRFKKLVYLAKLDIPTTKKPYSCRLGFASFLWAWDVSEKLAGRIMRWTSKDGRRDSYNRYGSAIPKFMYSRLSKCVKWRIQARESITILKKGVAEMHNYAFQKKKGFFNFSE